jgi:hypothetical protein
LSEECWTIDEFNKASGLPTIGNLNLFPKGFIFEFEIPAPLREVGSEKFFLIIEN